MLRLPRLLLLLLVPLLASCSAPWRATGGLLPTATPSIPASPAVGEDPAAPVAIDPASACSLIGLLITADRGDAAMGYRQMALTVRNCAAEPRELRGRPDIIVLDEDGRPLKVSVVAGRRHTEAPKRLPLKPGTTAWAVLSWRNTVTNTSGGAETGASLAVAVSPGEKRQLVPLPAPLDLGNTGRLETSAWF